LIAQRRDAAARQTTSYIARQMAKGPLKLAEKLGEEAMETVIAAVAQDDRALAGEAADLLFHLIILLNARGHPMSTMCSPSSNGARAIRVWLEKAGRSMSVRTVPL
jgi:phosphoribosyl-ATP pyrophosphohydrolase